MYIYIYVCVCVCMFVYCVFYITLSNTPTRYYNTRIRMAIHIAMYINIVMVMYTTSGLVGCGTYKVRTKYDQVLGLLSTI